MNLRSAFIPSAVLALFAAPVAAQAPTAATSSGITPADARARVHVLADDSMMGREAGTRGNVMGTDYIAREARRLGLQPAGENGTFFQTIPLVKRALDPAATLRADDHGFTLFTDYVPIPFTAGFIAVGDSLQAAGVPVVYGGRWGSADALAPEQTRGKLVVYAAAEGPMGWRFWNHVPLDRYRGAVGILIASLDASPAQLIDFVRAEQQGLRQERPEGLSPLVLVTRAAAERMLGAPLDRLPVGATGRPVTARIRYVETAAPHPARNVVAVLPGSDPSLRGQYVAIGAHNDHDGVGAAVDHDSLRAVNRLYRAMGADMPEPHLTGAQGERARVLRDSLARGRAARRDSIFNGADDDASGTAGVLEIAEHFAAQATRPRRSLLFVWHTAEEKGLLGSEYFTDHPTVPRDSIVAQLNIDMIGRGTADDQAGTSRDRAPLMGGPGYVQLVGSRRLSRVLGDLVEERNRDGGHGLRFDYSIDADQHPAQIYCRSDHYNYARYGIPVTFFTTGLHFDYHQVTDEAQYLDYDRLAAVSRLIADVAGAIANRDQRLPLDGPKPDPAGQCQQ